MSDILLKDILNLSDDEVKNSKISFSISSGKGGELCIDRWLKDGDTSDGFSSYYGNARNFTLIGQYCFAFYKTEWSGNEYLLVGAGEISRIPSKEERLPAEFVPIEKFQKYVGRLIVEVYKGNKYGRYNFRMEKYIDAIKVKEILPEKYGGECFPGFDKIILNYEELYRGIYINRSWRDFLRKQKGVYVITDTSPDAEYSGLGRIYVGSATSEKGMLYDRWKNYVDNHTGGNKELNKIKSIKGEDYIKRYFQWSLIEHFDESVDDSLVLKRESYWKKVLNSVEQGLNDNR